jgi:hypothetical protein
MRVNSTGRQRILRESVTARIRQDNDMTTFSVSVDLNELDSLPPTAEVNVDLYRKTEVETFRLGTVADFGHLQDVPVERFPDPTGLQVRVRVVSTDSERKGQLRAFADGLKLETASTNPARTKPLLPFRGSDALGEQVWRLEIGPSGPIALMNSQLASWNATARSTSFVTLVYPEMMRQIGRWVASALHDGETADSGGDAFGAWTLFIRSMGVDLDKIDPDSTDEDLEEFAETCADRFSSQRGILEKFNQLTETTE